MKRPRIPSDIGLKVGTREQILWEGVAKEARVLIEQSENNLVIQRSLLGLAEQKISEEKEKLKA